MFFSIEGIRAQQFNRVEALANLAGISNNNGVAIADFGQDNDLDIFTLSINDYTAADLDMKVFPNPVKHLNEITITNTSVDNSFSLFDILGRRMSVQQNFISDRNMTKIKLGNLSPGIYFLKAKNLSADRQAITKKIIVNWLMSF